MSDPTARRADVLNQLLYAMNQTQGNKGWTLRQVRKYIFKRYRGGVRDQTIDLAIKQMKDLGFLEERTIKIANISRRRFFAREQQI